MIDRFDNPTRRALVLGGLASLFVMPFAKVCLAGNPGVHKLIPGTGEQLHPIGMGTWITFNVGRDNQLRNQRTRVLSEFFAMGGQLVDSSPMYGSSEQVLGYALSHLNNDRRLFSATKTWTRSLTQGREQFADSRQFWQQRQFDLLQIHNLVGWQTHLPELRSLKQAGLVRYIGVTTSHGRRHQELENMLISEPIDFVQLTYNILDRQAEQRLLPLAKEKGIGVIANRPFMGGRLFDIFQGKPLPTWHKEIGCQNWAQFFLRFILAHSAVTCAIPATTRVDHMRENMGAANLPMPEPGQAKRMLNYVKAL